MTKFYSRKQAGVVYGNVKRENIKMSKDAIGYMYDYAGETVSAAQHIETADALNACIRAAVDAIFANDYATAQFQIDQFQAELDNMAVAPVTDLF